MTLQHYDSTSYVKLSPSTPDPMAEQKKAEYAAHWRLVKRARFNAAKRLERKHRASTMAFVITGIIVFLSLPFELLFDDNLSLFTKRIFQFCGYIIGVLSLTIGIVEQAKNYPSRARHFDLCAKKINTIIRDLETSMMLTMDDLKPFIQRYEKALEEYEENHDDLDYSIAKATDDFETAHPALRATCRSKLSALRLLEHGEIYWIHATTWILPILAGILIWSFMAPTSTSDLKEAAQMPIPEQVVELPVEPNPYTGSAREAPHRSSGENGWQNITTTPPLNLPFSK